MLLKRKRSDSELSFSSNTTFSSPPRPNAYNFSAMAMMDIDSPVSPRTSLSSRPCTPSHLPSRTMKRFRDSRPSDEEVHRKFYEWRAHHQSQNQHQHQSHCLPSLSLSSSSSAVSPSFSSSVASTEHTLKILYEAQHHHQQQQCHPQQLPLEQQQQLPSVYSPPVAAVPQPQAPAQGQRSLHSFWNLPASTPSSASTTPAPSMPLTPAFESNQPSHCEDCGVGLGGEDVTMENEYGLVGASSHCGACGKAVCFSCSVSNLGEQRRCLMCAGRKKWVGGIGWAVSGAGVC